MKWPEEQQKPLLWAFLLGMFSHIAVDTVFHPMVYYFTGNYYLPDAKEQQAARMRHRAFEVFLDSCFQKEEGVLESRTIYEDTLKARWGLGGHLCAPWCHTGARED